MTKKVSKREMLAIIQKFAAVDSVSHSAVRGQPKGTVKAIQSYVATMNLRRMPIDSQEAFARWLNLHTARIQRILPNRSRPWGIARKTLNLFLRTCFYVHYLRREYGFAKVGKWLEVPLDGVVARELRRDAPRGALPQWKGLGGLRPKDSERYQQQARLRAQALGLSETVLLDNYLWVSGRER